MSKLLIIRLMKNKMRYIIYVFLIFISFHLKSINRFNYSDTIKIYEQRYDTLMEILPAFEMPIGFSEGHWNILYINEKVKEDFHIHNGHLNGVYKQYWPNGKIMYSGIFENGVIKKEWNIYNNIGKMVKQFIYIKGIRSLERMYNDKNELEQTIYYDTDGVRIKKVIKHQ